MIAMFSFDVELNDVCKVKHVTQCIGIEEQDFLGCWREDSQDSWNSRIGLGHSQLLNEFALKLRKLGDHLEEFVPIQELVDFLPLILPQKWFPCA